MDNKTLNNRILDLMHELAARSYMTNNDYEDFCVKLCELRAEIEEDD